MWHLGTWFSGGLGRVRFTVGLDDLKGLFQPKQFCDSLLAFTVFDESEDHMCVWQAKPGPQVAHRFGS